MKAFLSKMSNKPLDKKQQLRNKRWEGRKASLHSVSTHCGQKSFCKKIFVIGSYGCGNRGDDAILQSICEQFPHAQISATCGSYEKISSFLPVKDVSCRLNEGFSLSVLLSMLKDSFGMFKEVFCCDVLMFGGGSLIHDLTPYNLPFLYLWQSLAKIFHKKVCYYCMGVGPLQKEGSKKLSRFYLKKADDLSVRDYRGSAVCEELGIKAQLTADAAFGVKNKNACAGKTLQELGIKEKEYLCVTACQWFESSNFWKRKQMNFSEKEDNLAACIRELSRLFQKKVLFVPTVFHDALLGKRLQEKLSDIDFKIVPEHWNCKQMAEVIENSFLLFGMRMHSIIFAARQKVPFISLLYDEKVTELLKRLDMVEYGISMEDMKPEKVQQMGNRVLERYSEIENLLWKKSKYLEQDVKALSQMLCEKYS